MVEIIIEKHDSGQLVPVAELIRCGQCKYFDKLRLNYDGIGICRANNKIYTTKSDWYCADGVKKDE